MKKIILPALCCLALLCSCNNELPNQNPQDNPNNNGNTVLIKYQSDYGQKPEDISLEKGYRFTLNEVPPLEERGYVFEGWWDRIQIAEPNVYIAQKNVTLVAKWRYIVCNEIQDATVVCDDSVFHLKWENPTQESFNGTKITIKKDGEKIDEVTFDSTVSSYDYQVPANYEMYNFTIETLQIEKQNVKPTEVSGIAGNIFYVKSNGSNDNDGRSMQKPLASVLAAYKKVSAINDGESEYHIMLIDAPKSEEITLNKSNEYSTFYFNPSKQMNLVIETVGNENYPITRRGTGRAFYVGEKMNLTMNNITVTGGSSANSEFTSFKGAGLLVYGKLYMNNCVVTNNSAIVSGYKQSVYASGGGIYIIKGAYCKLINTDILNNSVSAYVNNSGNNYFTCSAYGGGIYCDGTLYMENGKISGNRSSHQYKGVYVSSEGRGDFTNVINEDD